MMRDSVWVTCAHPECFRGTFADPHHLENICAAGGWLCWHHGDAPTPTHDKRS